MPHIIVKLYPGRSEEQKMQLTEKIVKDIVEVTECKETSVSLSIEEIEPADWAQKVYKTDIMDQKVLLYKKPGYNPFLREEKKKEKTTRLMEKIREAARMAQKKDLSGEFNAMSWLDLELEDSPEFFDTFFDTPWGQLSETEQEKRAKTIRSVL